MTLSPSSRRQLGQLDISTLELEWGSVGLAAVEGVFYHQMLDTGGFRRGRWTRHPASTRSHSSEESLHGHEMAVRNDYIALY